MDSSKFINQEI